MANHKVAFGFVGKHIKRTKRDPVALADASLG